MLTFDIRRAGASDASGIAAAHLDSIRSLGAMHYEPAIVREWGGGIGADRYLQAMALGEAFFIATGDLSGVPAILGFSSHRVDEDEHRTAVYVRGSAARQGVGSALFRAAEADVIASGGTSIHVDASLAAVEFYRAHGFEEIGRGEHRLRSGQTMACVFMRKDLSR